MFYARYASQFVGMIFQTRFRLAIENILSVQQCVNIKEKINYGKRM